MSPEDKIFIPACYVKNDVATPAAASSGKKGDQYSWK